MLPDLGPEDVPDIETLSPDELKMVPGDMIKWECCVAGCKHFTRVKDFGILPKVYWRKRWVDVSQLVYFCAQHWKMERAHVKLHRDYLPAEGFKTGPGIEHLKTADNEKR